MNTAPAANPIEKHRTISVCVDIFSTWNIPTASKQT